MEISAHPGDLQQLWFYLIFGEIGMVLMMFILSWDIVAVCILSVCALFLGCNAYVEWLYFSRKIVLAEDGCSFISARGTKKYSWEELHLQYVEDELSFSFDDRFPGAGLILSDKPISKPKCIGEQMYCLFVHPTTSVFIRFKSSFDDPKSEMRYWKFAYRGFVADKNQILEFLNSVGKAESMLRNRKNRGIRSVVRR